MNDNNNNWQSFNLLMNDALFVQVSHSFNYLAKYDAGISLRQAVASRRVACVEDVVVASFFGELFHNVNLLVGDEHVEDCHLF